MRSNRTNIARLCAGVAPLAILFATPATAQTAPAAQAPAAAPEDTTTPDVVVTGSLFRRTDTETPSPVTTLSAATLEARGLTTVSDAVQSIAAGNGGNIPQGFTGAFASGSSAISLRGLTTNSTLTLFDGLRAANYPLADDGQRSFVDLNTIQDSIVDRVEVLRDGASSTYGADAIAGVVNIILKKEYKGLGGRVEAGTTEHGDTGNQRVSLTAGYGSLAEQGFNIYISGEYQHQSQLFAHDRGFPFNTNNLTSITQTGGFTGRNGNTFVTPPASSSTGGTTAAIVRPATQTTPGNPLSGVTTAGGLFQVLNAGGCAAAGQVTHTNAAGSYCEQDLINKYTILLPEQTRFGGTLHATVNVGSDAQAYIAATFYQSKVLLNGTPQSIRSTNPVDTRTIVLPALLSNGTLNPNNPFAASGQAALIYYRFGDIPSSLTNTSRTYRIAGGIDGKFGDGFNYSVAGTYMRTDLTQYRKGFLYIPGLVAAINNGTYNFVNPSLNTQAVRDSISPSFSTYDNSELWQVQATITKDLFTLPGGPLQVGVGGQERFESVYDPTVVPNRDYITVNPFQAVGRRYVTAAFFEINAPILDNLEVNASGRYDHYSIGFSHFSPKIGAKWSPIRQIAIRGTYSEGFRAPSIPETSGAVIGFTNYTPIAGAGDAALRAQYGNDSYITTTYGLGNNSAGNPNVKPETSRSFTGGIVVQPTPWLSATFDYYNIQKKNLILSAGGNPATIADNYLRTGVVPAGVGVTLNPVDVSHPTLRPTVYSVDFLYSNGNTLKTAGLDAQITATFKMSPDWKFTTSLEGTEILYYDVDDGTGTGIQHFVGTLASYAVTSASGTPRWRANWQNTLEYRNFSLSATVNYVSGYKGYADDNSGPGSTCANAIETSVTYAPDFSSATATGPALQCDVRHFLDVDLVGRVKVGEKFAFYVNVINAFNAKAPFDPNTYGGNNYNPAFATQGVIGRMFRAGATFKF
jgi:iron complex outermembrane receptor protein